MKRTFFYISKYIKKQSHETATTRKFPNPPYTHVDSLFISFYLSSFSLLSLVSDKGVDLSKYSVHTVAAIVKSYLKSIPQPLLGWCVKIPLNFTSIHVYAMLILWSLSNGHFDVVM